MVPIAAAFLLFVGIWQAGAVVVGRHTFDLDVPSGRSADWTIADLGKANMLEGEFEVIELRKDPKFRPTFTISLGSSSREVGIQFIHAQDNRDLRVDVLVVERDRLIGRRTFDDWRVAKGQKIQLTLDWSASGVLAVSSGGVERASFPRDFTPSSVKISASTGELKGHRLVFWSK